MLNKANWAQTKRKFDAFWKRENAGAPLMRIVAEKPGARDASLEAMLKPRDMADQYENPFRIIERYRYFCRTHEFLAESFPNVSADFGPGAIAAYLGSEITFHPDTVWLSECVADWGAHPPLAFEPNNPWYLRHMRVFAEVARLAGEDFYVGVPDLGENLDVLASLRGAQNTVFDMMDEPEALHKRLGEVQAVYPEYFDRYFALAKREEDGAPASCYTVFQLWGRGKTIKTQCDFSAMVSPDQFREFVAPSLRAQARAADNVLYHLDGPDAIRHVPALMEIDEIDALQWVAGVSNPDGTYARWYPIYDAAIRAKKALWIQTYPDEMNALLGRLDALVRRYGSNAMFIHFYPMPLSDAERILAHADKYWKDIEGSVR